MIDLLWDIASDLLNATTAVLADGGLDVPERLYVDTPPITAPVEFGDDCTGQVNVTIGPLVPSRLALQSRARPAPPSCSHVWDCTFTIALLRCMPAPYDGLPSPEQLSEVAQAHARDEWQLGRGLAHKWANGALTPSYNQDICGFSQLGNLVAVNPQGMIRGWQVPLTLMVTDTYDPTTGA